MYFEKQIVKPLIVSHLKQTKSSLCHLDLVLVYTFVAITRFPVKHFIVNLLRKRYGKILVKNVRKFEKCDFQYNMDLDSLLTPKEKKYHNEVFNVQGGQQSIEVFKNLHLSVKIFESRDIKRTQAG